MEKVKSKLGFLLALILILPCVLLFTACNNDNPEETTVASNRVMTLEMNPTVSFVVDKDNKISSVSLDNSDAGDIFVNVNFVGKDVDSAIQIFIERSTISGHVNSNVTIKVGGSDDGDIEALKTKAKAKIEETLSTLGIDANVSLKDISSDEIINKVKDLAKEYTDAELKKLSNEDLIALYNERQNYYKDLGYSQVKSIETYLNSGLIDAQIESARKTLESAQTIIDSLPIVTEEAQKQLNEAKKAFEEVVNQYKTEWQNQINLYKASYEKLKEDLIKDYKSTVEANKSAFFKSLDEAKASGKITQEQYDYWKNLVEENLPA